jgi:WS/DGAT/MGAT family acyltransferase
MDASFLYMETPTTHFHVVGVLVVDPTDAPEFGVDKLKQVLTERLHLLAPFRRRLVEVPFKLGRPVWIEDGTFDIDRHVHHAALPAPGSRRELAEFVGDFASSQLDRTHPLWEMWVVEGLEDGNVALVTKMHHAAIDGVTGADLMVHLFDLTPEIAATPAPDEPWEPEAPPSDLQLAVEALFTSAIRPRQLIKVARNLAGATGGIVEALRASRRPGGPSVTLPFTAPRTPWNKALTPHRSVAFAGCALEDLKAIKTGLGGTINDVVLAATAGALRRWLHAHGGVPEEPLVASCPVSVHDTSTDDSMNKVSSMFVSLPVQLADPVERFAAIRESTRGAKELHGALGAETIMQLAETAPPALANLGARLYSSSRLADRHRPIQSLVVSNVPGPPIPLYCLGARVVATYPMGPLIEGSGLNLTVLSNTGNMDIGVMACRELVPDLQDIADAFVQEVELLLKAAAART